MGMTIGRAGGGEDDRLTSFASGKAISPFISNDLASRMKSPVRFNAPTGGTPATGYEATILPNGRLRHISGAEFTVERGDGYTDINAAPETLEEFQSFELARGVPVHDLAQRLIRLAREAGQWLERNP